MTTDQVLHIAWDGPHTWPSLRQPSPLSYLSGVYLWTLENNEGYVVYGCGLTRRSIRERLGEHRRQYLSGKYALYDLEAARNGIRHELWHGLWAGYDSDERKAEFVRRADELRSLAEIQMSVTRIFVANISDVRLQHRIEAGVMNALYSAPKPYCDLPDVGMFLSSRFVDEPVIRVISRASVPFCNFPEQIEV